MQDAAAEQLTALTDTSSSTTWAKHPEANTQQQEHEQWPAPAARSVSCGDEPAVEQCTQQPDCDLDCTLSCPLPRRGQAHKRRQELLAAFRQVGMGSACPAPQPGPESLNEELFDHMGREFEQESEQEQGPTQKPATPQPVLPPRRVTSSSSQQQQEEQQRRQYEQQRRQHEQQLRQEEQQQWQAEQQQQRRQQRRQEEPLQPHDEQERQQRLQEQQQQYQRQRWQQDWCHSQPLPLPCQQHQHQQKQQQVQLQRQHQQPQQHLHEQLHEQQEQRQQRQHDRHEHQQRQLGQPVKLSDTARRAAKFACAAPGTRLDCPLSPSISSSQSLTVSDSRIILLFDINGVLTKSGTRRHGADADGSRLRPGLEHLRRLQGRFRLGIYASSAARTVAQVLRETERRVGQELFENGLVLHRWAGV